MAKHAALSESPITLRLPTDILERLDAVAPAIGKDSDTAALLGGVSRSSVVRLAIVEGLRVLERRYRGKSR